jgi:signal transduction histidine kinase
MPEPFRHQATNGRGPLGVGVAGMRERVEQLNGRLEIESAIGQGTNIRIVLPNGNAAAHSGKKNRPDSR